ncbi:MAG: tRNA (guanosine(37)-N1)-methyltransferase TrmD [Caldiserica bacterium]|jgi:tRNA (guanine37-N1)-methyltransferase|nr:tRNA (guanosine(37)-N1)-methyltransferase TrmD [Caldisericota bacterium]MDH7562897.1 tRNA (guanosine(37)-N1)-methyltransferase TrmD [Caldisericota bacterium]
MRFFVLTVFPEIFKFLEDYSVLGRAIKNGVVEVKTLNLRDFSRDKHRTTDDYPFGGGPGMVMLAEPIFKALNGVKKEAEGVYTILLGPGGTRFSHQKALELARMKDICLICGHYEGVDSRVREVCDEEISLGDFVTSGGELPAMVIIDAISRLTPGVLGNIESLGEESFFEGLLEYDHFTRPRELTIPEILISGHHAAISDWRLRNSLLKTLFFRPDLLSKKELNPKERKILSETLQVLEGILKKNQ